jgi:WD40 repeat protein
VYSASFSPDSRLIVTAGLDGAARVYACETCSAVDLLALAQARITRQLTPMEREIYLHEQTH